MAYPLFGTTATHVAAWYATLGSDATEDYLRALKANDIILVDGNAKTRDMVVNGEVPIAFTDTDDANVAIIQGKPVDIIYPDKQGIGTLFIPNTVAMINGAPNPDNAKKLIDYLLSSETETKLAFGESAQLPLREGVDKPSHIADINDITTMQVNYEQVTTFIEQSAKFNQELFIR